MAKYPIVTVKLDGEQIKALLSLGPYCPFCQDKLIRAHIECDDGSSWVHGWVCNCPENASEFAEHDPDDTA